MKVINLYPFISLIKKIKYLNFKSHYDLKIIIANNQLMLLFKLDLCL